MRKIAFRAWNFAKKEDLAIPNLIKQYRTFLGMTQVGFTQKYGMKSIILGSLWESGKREAPFVIVQDVFNWYLDSQRHQIIQEAKRRVEKMKEDLIYHQCPLKVKGYECPQERYNQALDDALSELSKMEEV